MRHYLFSVIVLAGLGLGATPARSQSAVEGRVDRLEGEMRAVQRKVFPGGAGQYIQPDNRPQSPEEILPGTPSSGPIDDLTARVNALETQLRTITGEVETTQHRLQLVEGRLKTLEARPVSTDGGVVETPTALPAPSGPTPAAGKSTSKSVTPPPTVATKPEKPSTDPARTKRVAAIERPVTGDAGEDAYLYGFRLWDAKLYPEAEAQLISVTSKYPKHKRASYAQNLLGRSYLDEGKPSLASLAFYDSYDKFPDGDRAAESLYYLAQALVKLNKPADKVCKVYTVLTKNYAAKIEADPKMKAGIAKGQAESRCA